MHSRIVSFFCLILLSIAACGGQPSAPGAALLATPKSLYLVPAPADAPPTTTRSQSISDDTGNCGFSAVSTGSPPAARVHPEAVTPAAIDPSSIRDRHLTYEGHSTNAVRRGASMELACLRQIPLETTTS